MKKKVVYKIIITTVLVYVLAIIHTYISLNEYTNTQSSACFNCSFINEIIRYSLISLFLLPTLVFINKIPLSRKFIIILLSVFFMLILFLISANIFEARVSSWNSYSTIEFYLSVLKKTMFTLPIFTFLFFLFLKFFYLYSKNYSSNEL